MADEGITDRPSRPERDNGHYEDEDERPAKKRKRRRDDEGGLTSEERQWGMFCHLSALAGLLTGVFILGPLICWLVKKDESEFVDDHGKESVNFQINMLLWTIVAVAITVATCGFGFPVLFVPALMCIIFPIIAGMKANEGDFYKYPASYPFLK